MLLVGNVTSFNQSECIISELIRYKTVILFYKIVSWLLDHLETP